MSNYPTHKIEKLIEQITARNEILIETLKGADLTEEELKSYKLILPSTCINADDLNLAIDDCISILRRAKAYAK